MQISPQVPHSWREAAQIALAIFLTWFVTSVLAAIAFIPKLAVGLWQKRKSSAEIHLSEAQTELTLAQAEGVRLRSKRTSAELIDELNRLAAESAMELRELEDKLRTRDAELEVLNNQVAKARAAGFLDRAEKGGTGPNPAA